MKRTTLLTVILAITVTVSMIMTVQAETLMAGKRGHGPGGSGIGGMRVLMQLDLSQDQKQTIYDILQKYEDKQQAAQVRLRVHKEDFFSLASEGPFNEDAVRQAFQESVPDLEEIFVLRAKKHSEIRAVLTDEQLEELQEIRAEHAGRRQNKRNNEFRRAMLETWLIMDSK